MSQASYKSGNGSAKWLHEKTLSYSPSHSGPSFVLDLMLSPFASFAFKFTKRPLARYLGS